MTTRCGIYRIVNTVTGVFYIGSSKNIPCRWRTHLKQLRHNTHGNQKLQNSWNKHGEQAFSFEVIEPCPEQGMRERETYWIQATWMFNYNLSEKGTGNVRRGWHHTPETIAKMKSKKHRPYTEKEKLAQSLRLRGIPKTYEHRQNISKAKKGKDSLSPEAHKRQAISLSQTIKGENNPNFGHRWGEKQRNKMSHTLATKTYNFTCDHCSRIFTGVTRSSYGGHRRKCLLYSST
jgi:group I intron endonuclease